MCGNVLDSSVSDVHGRPLCQAVLRLLRDYATPVQTNVKDMRRVIVKNVHISAASAQMNAGVWLIKS
jgi:hypothetical protein